MFLECIEIAGFRGINYLSFKLNQSTLLIGENAWGKSSLLDVLTLLLAPGSECYQFTLQDFHQAASEDNERTRTIRIMLTFKEIAKDSSKSQRCCKLAPVWIKDTEGISRVYYCIEGNRSKQNTITTQHSFLDQQGEILSLPGSQHLISELIRLIPVLRLRQIKLLKRSTDDYFEQVLPEYLQELSHYIEYPIKEMDGEDLKSAIQAMRLLLENYLFGYRNGQLLDENSVNNINIVDWRALKTLNRVIEQQNNRGSKMVLLKIFAALLRVKNPQELDNDAHPLLLVEEPESSLHPIMLSISWALLNHLPLQKVTTTNSGDVLSLVPLENVCRLVKDDKQVSAYGISDRRLSMEEERRLAFHIRFNRASSLFARCWLLVEGETEVWMLNELARQCGYHFDTEGIRIIEFAQCGLKPLIKFADRMGIAWHVLVDGDEAGKKYAGTARSFIANTSFDEHDKLTVLPALDLEHFMYRSGFNSVYKRVAALPEQVNLSARKVIHKAIQRSSKPDLAIEVAEQAAQWGTESIPVILRTMFSRVLWLARGKANAE